MGTASIARPGPLTTHLLAIFALTAIVRGGLAEPAFAQDDSDIWKTSAPMLTPRRLMAAAVAAGKGEDEAIYTFGGCGSPCFDPPVHTSTFEETRLEVFENDSWSVRKPIPAILFGAAAATVKDKDKDKIYLFGGYVTGSDTYEYDPGGDTWRRRAPMPTPRHGLAAVALDRKVYVLGGSNGSAATGALEVYDPVNNSWSQKAPMPTPRVFLAAAAVNGKIYAIGGSPDGSGDGNGNATGRTDVVEVYDTATESWSRAAWLPVALQVSAAVTLNDKIYVFGGFIPGSGVQGSTFEYDPGKNVWTSKAPMLEARDQAPAVVQEGIAHVLGGSVDCHCKARDTHDSYTPPTPPAMADLEISKSGPAGPVCVGQRVTFTIKVTNLGPDKVSGATVMDDLKATGLQDVRWCRGSGCTPSRTDDLLDTVDLDVKVVPVTYTVVGTVAPTATGMISNSAKVLAPNNVKDPKPANNEISTPPSSIVQSLVSITKTAGRSTAAPGDILRYTITVENLCPQAVQTTVTDDLEAGFHWCRGPDCNPTKPGNISETVSLPANGTLMYTVVGTVPCACGKNQIENEACVSVGQTETCDSVSVPILPAPGGDLALAVTGANDSKDCGPLPYTFTVTNKGPGIACGAVLQAQPPAGSALVSISSPCTGFPCHLGNLAPGQQVQVTAAFSIPTDARCAVPLATTASVNACGSAASKIETTLPCVLSVTKSDGLDTAAPGDAILYTMGITNQSCAAVSGAKVMDVFPADLQNVQWCRGEGCPPQPHPVPLTDLLNLPLGGKETYRAQGTVSLAFTGTLSNTVTVTPPGSPPVSATDKTEIPAAPRGLTASCEALSGTPSVGGMITKTFVISNDGPAAQGDNPGPEFEDVLPTGLTLISAVASSGTVTTGANTVRWDGSLPPGGTVTVQVTASIDAGTAGMKICNGGATYFDADGDGTNESSRPVPAPCCFRVLPPGEAPPIPSLSGSGLIALALLLAVLALLRLRRRSRTG